MSGAGLPRFTSESALPSTMWWNFENTCWYWAVFTWKVSLPLLVATAMGTLLACKWSINRSAPVNGSSHRTLTHKIRVVPIRTWQERNVHHSDNLVFVELGEQVFGVHVHFQFFRDDRGRVNRHRTHHSDAQVFRVFFAVVLQDIGDARQVHLLRVYNNAGTTVMFNWFSLRFDRGDLKKNCQGRNEKTETDSPTSHLPNSRPSMSKMTWVTGEYLDILSHFVDDEQKKEKNNTPFTTRNEKTSTISSVSHGNRTRQDHVKIPWWIRTDESRTVGRRHGVPNGDGDINFFFCSPYQRLSYLLRCARSRICGGIIGRDIGETREMPVALLNSAGFYLRKEKSENSNVVRVRFHGE